MSDPDATIEAVLDEVRAIASGLNKIGDDTRMIRAHLAEIDAQLEAMPQRDEIDALRAIVGELQSAVSELQAFVNSDPPLQDRLIALEENVAQYKVDTAAREDVIADDAGVATDKAHREMAQGEADAVVEVSQRLQDVAHGVRFKKLADRLEKDEGIIATLVKAVLDLQGHKLLSTAIGGLVLAVVLFIGAAALWGAPSLP